jgi:hypothetical protein
VSATCGEGEPHKARLTMHARPGRVGATLGMPGDNFRREAATRGWLVEIIFIVIYAACAAAPPAAPSPRVLDSHLPPPCA